MKRILALLLCAVLVLSLWGCKQESEPEETTEEATEAVTEEVTEEETEEETTEEVTEPEETPSSPILYKVTDSDGRFIYLLGSIHVATEDMYPLPDYVLDAYDACDALAVECDIVSAEKDMSLAMEMAKSMILTDGTKISDHISAEAYEKAVEILKENKSYSGALDMYKPVMWYSFISTFAMDKAGVDVNKGIDRYFIEDAIDQDKPLLEIESVAEQYAILSGMSMELQVLMLEETLAYYDNPVYNLNIRAMCSAWAAGDEEGLLNMMNTDADALPPEQAELLKEFNDTLEGQRNVNMTNFAVDSLELGGSVFIVVGAAHVFGDDGMAAVLAEAGYTVELVTK